MNIKVGQKWICIKDYDLLDIIDNKIQKTFKINEQVIIKDIFRYEEIGYMNKEDCYPIGLDITSPYMRNLKIKELIDNFILLAEYRDKQINEILEL